MNNDKNIFERVYDRMEASDQHAAENWDNYKLYIKRKTSGPRWRVAKMVAGVLAVTGVILAIASFYAIGVLLFVAAVIMGLAAKS